MTQTDKNILEEIEEEKKELYLNIFLTTLTFLGLVFGVVSQVWELPMAYVAIAFLLAYVAGGSRASISAFHNLFKGHLDINVLMALAALAAAAVGEVRDGAILLFLFSFAGTLEHYAMGNTKRAIASLMKLKPDEANILQSDGVTKKVAVEFIRIGDQVVVRPGERLPVDGVIISGQGAIDQSSVTGESVPVDKGPADAVFAGTVNQNSVLIVEVTKEAAQSTIARMIELVVEAQAKRSPSERFSELFGRRYTIIVLVCSMIVLGIFLGLGTSLYEAAYTAATLLVVASPCAIVISVPAAVLSALSAAAHTGVLFKGGAALEDFGKATIIACDKTGTLTEGKMKVSGVVSFSDADHDTIVAVAAALEGHSDHPLARSIMTYAAECHISIPNVTDIVEMPGKGVVANYLGSVRWIGNRALLKKQGITITRAIEAKLIDLEKEGKTTIIVGHLQSVLGVICISDTVRPSAALAIAGLRRHGVKKFVMLTGDTELVAEAVGAELGLDPKDIHGALLPEDKVRVIEQLRKEGVVAFVGDGVNDAAALVSAHVGVAMGVDGSDVAIEAADVALLSNDFEKLARTYELSQKANRIIKQNLALALGLMVVMVVVTIFWYLPLPLGVIGHEGGTLLVVANGLRLLWSGK